MIFTGTGMMVYRSGSVGVLLAGNKGGRCQGKHSRDMRTLSCFGSRHYSIAGRDDEIPTNHRLRKTLVLELVQI